MVVRPDGTHQVTYRGKPLYLSNNDAVHPASAVQLRRRRHQRSRRRDDLGHVQHDSTRALDRWPGAQREAPAIAGRGFAPLGNGAPEPSRTHVPCGPRAPLTAPSRARRRSRSRGARRRKPGRTVASLGQARRGRRDAPATVARGGGRHDPALAAAAGREHALDVRAPPRSATSGAAAAQQTVAARLAMAIPRPASAGTTASRSTASRSSSPRSHLARLRAMPGATVWPTATYHRCATARSTSAHRGSRPSLIGAPTSGGRRSRTPGRG